MKKDYLALGHKTGMGGRYLPKFVSRRFGGDQSFRNYAYKSDGKDGKDDDDSEEIKDKASLLKSLNEMKAALEAKGKKDAKEAVDAAFEEKMKAITDQIEEVKKLGEGVKPEDFAKVQNDLAVTIKAFDMLQSRVVATKMPANPEAKTLNQRIAEAVEEKGDDIAKFSRGEIKRLDLSLKAVADVSTANVTGGSVWGAIYRPGIIMNPDTPNQVRDLIPVSPAGPGTNHYFMRENGAGEGNPGWTAEKQAAAATTQATGLKPQMDFDLIEANVPFEILAGWMKLSRKSLNNIPGLTAFLQRRLPQRLLDVETAALLYGTGTNNQPSGILNAGNYVASTSSATVLVEKIIDDMALLEGTYKRMASGVALRPEDYYSFFKNKADGSGEYDLPQGVVFVNGILYILGKPVITLHGLTAGDYIVGDWRNGAELLQQEGMTLQFFEQDDKNVQTNQVTARIEETVAFPVYGDNYFIKGSVPTP